MKICQATRSDCALVVPLIANFRVALKGYKGIHAQPDADAAAEEFCEYVDADWPIYICMEKEIPAGYLVCRVEEPVVWVESIYVEGRFRRRGIAGALFERAEQLARSYGEETVYNYVHPNNHGMIRFLASCGYDVLNLIEIRKKLPGEQTCERICVGVNEFDY